MMFLVNSEHQGLTVLPTHRVLHDLDLADRRALVGPIMQHFRVKMYTHAAAGRAEAQRRWLRDLADLEPGEHKIGAYVRNSGCYALAAVDRRTADVALLLNPTRLEDVLEIARAGERMPRKSTHFYPKPVSGLVFYPMDYPMD